MCRILAKGKQSGIRRLRFENPRHAVKLFKKFVTEKVCTPNEVTYVAVINGLCKVGYNDRMVVLVGFIERQGPLRPDLIVYNTVIESLCKDGMVDDSLRMFYRLMSKGVESNVAT
ncbi:putative tetratricopeptide-like helical domain-containing protein [Tanacetum coccineum]|uniref:Tetratricopeptide-like helical domain-containing protein n=1 Tax=Tanacetum coccineum TaxID=301880 RepID=A0ABQ4ZUC7_9ASTR